MRKLKSGASATLAPTYNDCLSWLTRNIRALSDGQIARVRGVSPAIVRQGFRRLERRGLVSLSQGFIQIPNAIGEPLYEWRPNADTLKPDWDSLSYKAQSRWNVPPLRALVASATKQAMELTGGRIGGRPSRPLEMSHDLTLTQLFLRMLAQDPEVANHWFPEDALTGLSAGEKRPDALLRTIGKDVFIELAGKAYSAKKLEAIHTDFARRGVHHRIY